MDRCTAEGDQVCAKKDVPPEIVSQDRRFHARPGECAQIECLRGWPTLDPRSNDYSRPWLFEMRLSLSGHRVRCSIWSLESQHQWCALLERAWRYFGGATREIVYGESVMQSVPARVWQIEQNSMLQATLEHYKVHLQKVRSHLHPHDRHAMVGHVRDIDKQHDADDDLKFESLAQQDAYWLRLSSHWVVRSLDGRDTRQIFKSYELERKSLLHLPALGVQYFKEMDRLVCDDGCIRLGNSSFMAWPAPIGSRVRVRRYKRKLEIYGPGGGLIRLYWQDDEHARVCAPLAQRLFCGSEQTAMLLRQAQRMGPSVGQVCEQLFVQQGRLAHRRMWAIVGLGRHFDSGCVDQACQRALQSRVLTYRNVKRHAQDLQRNLRASGLHNAQLALPW